MSVSPVAFLGTSTASANASPVAFRKPQPAADPASFLPEESQERLSLLRLAKANADSALTNAADAGVPNALMSGLMAEKASTAANLRAAEHLVAQLRAPVAALEPADLRGARLPAVRSEIEKVENRLTQLQTMRPTRAEQIERLKLVVAGTGATLAPEIFRLARDEWANPIDPAMALRQLLGISGDAMALICAIFPDAIVEKLAESIPDDVEGALPHAERLAEIEQTRKTLLDLSWVEECLLRDMGTAAPLRRSTAPAECLIGVVAG